jgi:hypothetical protein
MRRERLCAPRERRGGKELPSIQLFFRMQLRQQRNNATNWINVIFGQHLANVRRVPLICDSLLTPGGCGLRLSWSEWHAILCYLRAIFASYSTIRSFASFCASASAGLFASAVVTAASAAAASA